MPAQQASQFEAPTGATRMFRPADAHLVGGTIAPQASPAVPSHIFVTALFRDVVLKDLEMSK